MNIATLIAVTGNHAAGIGTIIGYGGLAIFVIVQVIRYTILDLVDRHNRKRRDVVFAEMEAENDPVLARDWQLFRAEYAARLTARGIKLP